MGELGWEDPLEEGTAAHSSILVWRVPMERGAWGPKESDTTERLSIKNYKFIETQSIYIPLSFKVCSGFIYICVCVCVRTRAVFSHSVVSNSVCVCVCASACCV